MYNKNHDTTTTNCHVVSQDFVLDQYKTQRVITHCYHNKYFSTNFLEKRPITVFNINFLRFKMPSKNYTLFKNNFLKI